MSSESPRAGLAARRNTRGGVAAIVWASGSFVLNDCGPSVRGVGKSVVTARLKLMVLLGPVVVTCASLLAAPELLYADSHAAVGAVRVRWSRLLRVVGGGRSQLRGVRVPVGMELRSGVQRRDTAARVRRADARPAREWAASVPGFDRHGSGRHSVERRQHIRGRPADELGLLRFH